MRSRRERLQRLWPAVLLLVTSVLGRESYAEHLSIRPLDDGKVAAAFNFTIRSPDWSRQLTQPAANVQLSHSHLLPRSMAAIVRAHHVRELHFTLVAGRWQYDRWGYPLLGDGAAYGAEAWAWLDHDPTRSRDEAWSALTNSLAGLFCASLNRFTSAHTTSPRHSFAPNAALNASSYDFRHAMLPLERPCTENLTPFLALLPCRSRAGIAQLLKPHHVFDANWQRLGVHIRHDADDALVLELDVEIVPNPIRIDQARGGPGRRDWSFSQTFGSAIDHRCEPASSSVIDVALRNSTHRLEPNGWSTEVGGSCATRDVQSSAMPLDVIMSWPDEQEFRYPSVYDVAPVRVTRRLTGYGGERGGIGVNLRNDEDRAVEVTWLEEWPWWLKAYLHTLTISVDGVRHDDLLLDLSYLPAQDRVRPTLIEARLRLPPRSTVSVLLEYEKAFMRYHEYPSDANRGFDVPAAIVVVRGNGSAPDRRIYSTSALIMLPLPDFSMPYNVIILTSTLVALFFGSVFNILFMLVRLIPEAKLARVNAASSAVKAD